MSTAMRASFTTGVPTQWTIETQLPVSFAIKNSPGIFSPKNPDLLEYGSQGPSARRLIVIDRNITQYYLRDVVRYFESRAVQAHIIGVDASENKKDLESLFLILKEMEHFGILRRDEPLIAVGGGVLLDIAGMAAGLYRRGIPYIRVPTTLIGLIDASVGAKTGINYQVRRNRLGSYYPPIAVYLDRSFLRTLDPVDVSSGLGEILKMAVIKDLDLFLLIERHGEALFASKFAGVAAADEVICRAVQRMKEELETNLWEKDLKRLMDFGHSFSPVVEMRSIHDNGQVPLTHGQAVCLDVLLSSILSHQRGMLPYEDVLRIARAARSMALPTNHALFQAPLILLEALRDTMKHRNGDQNLPFPRGIGDPVFVNDLSYEEIKSGVEGLRAVNVALSEGRAQP